MIIEGKLLLVREVADRLETTERTVLRLIVRGDLPRAFKVGRAWRVPQADVEEYIEAQWRERQAAASAGEKS